MTRRSLLSLIVFLCLGASALAPVSAGAAPPEGRTARAAVAKIDYPGNGIEIARQSGAQRRLTGTPRSFKKFVTARLDVLFDQAGSKPRCAASPTIVVDRYHGDGWASAGEGWYGACPEGGYAVIYERARSGWQQILGTQEARFCQDLAWYGVPAFIGGRRCLDEELDQVRYHRGKADTASPDATARRVISIVGGNPIVPQDDVLQPAAAEQLAVVIARKGYLSVDACVAAGDGGPVAAHLGAAPYGCAVTATYKKNKAESILLRMTDDFLVTELYPFD